MKKLMCLWLVLAMSAVVSADIVRTECVRDGSGATAEVARMRYTGSQIDYDYPNSWMFVGDHLHGASHMSDGITKFDLSVLPALGAGESFVINGVTLEGYYDATGSYDSGGGDNNVYVRLEKYTFDNSSIPILLADAPDNAATAYVTTLVFDSGQTQYYFNDPAVLAGVAADIAAGYAYTGLTWQIARPDGTAIPNGGEPSGTDPTKSEIYRIGFPGWEWGALLDSPALVIDYTIIPEPATMALLALGSALLLKRKKA